MTNLAAFTAFTGYRVYPPYISINVRRPGVVDVHVRSSEADGSKEACISIPDADFDALVEALVRSRRVDETVLDGPTNIA
jgi:hypothetical protein